LNASKQGLVRTVGGYLKSLSQLDFKAISQRSKVLLGFEKDPYDTYDFQLEIQHKYNLKTLYFILFATYGKNDKNVPITSRKFCELIKSISDNAEVGIHPSYGSNYSQDRLPKEIKRLSKVLNREITKSRQHFLKLSFPETYHHLLELGITDDYTMGFASEIGFRAGICDSFNFYDF
jgi:muramoyltetrapeptide carboxypeptidase LdcA involved in peptidoglycan recycling